MTHKKNRESILKKNYSFIYNFIKIREINNEQVKFNTIQLYLERFK